MTNRSDRFIAQGSAKVVKVRSPQADQLMAILQANGTTVRNNAEGTLEVDGLISDEIGTLAAGHGITLFELATQEASLEEAYMAITEAAREYTTPSSTKENP